MAYHILNGDALKYQFPTKDISGELIVVRECLVEGDVRGGNLQDFFQTRAQTLQELYGPLDQDYFEKVVPELNKISSIKSGEVNLWFEDDLFCQVNLWFVCSLLSDKKVSINLVRPSTNLQYGFGGMDHDALAHTFRSRTAISPENLGAFASLWTAFQGGDNSQLQAISRRLQASFPFVIDAIKAQVERGIGSQAGRPEKMLLQIIEEVGPDFNKVFPEFCIREPIYGFGDLQVKRLFDRLISN